MIEGLYYTNKNGKQVPVQMTRHALSRFLQRYQIAYGKRVVDCDIGPTLCKLFNMADRVTKLGPKGRSRMKRHGKDTLYFRREKLTFVVQNSKIVTVEISAKGERWKN